MGNSSSKKGADADPSSKVGGGAPAGLAPISVAAEERKDGSGSGSASSPPSSPLAVPLPTAPFVVGIRGGFEGAPMPNQFGLVLDVEALRLHSLEDNTLLRIYPYHTILCWGYDARTFQWRAFTNSKESEATTFTVLTFEGSEIERCMMLTVMSLMQKMQSRCVPEEAFKQLNETLPILADQGFPEHCIVAVRQMALQRRFDAKQAVSLLKTLENISPFDKLEAAVALHPAMMAPSSFLLVLDCFDDAGERANVLHRLGLQETAEGGLAPAKKR